MCAARTVGWNRQLDELEMAHVKGLVEGLVEVLVEGSRQVGVDLSPVEWQQKDRLSRALLDMCVFVPGPVTGLAQQR